LVVIKASNDDLLRHRTWGHF